MRIAIIDDNKDDYAVLRSNIEQYSAQKGIVVSIDYFNSGINFLDKYRSFDIVFMDIDMEAMNGVSVCRELRKIDENVLIVFVTNFSGYALQGYSVHAYDFLIKPVAYGILSILLDKICLLVNARNKVKVISIKNRGQTVTVNAADVLYIEITGHKRIWHTRNGVLTDFGLMSDLEKELSDYNFARCHNSYLINLKNVDRIDGNEVVIANDKIIISRTKRKEFMAAFADCINKGNV